MTELVVVRETVQIVVTAPGPQGPPGPPGAGGGVSYQHDQTTPSASWVIAHGLGVLTSVTLFDDFGDIVHGDIHWTLDRMTTSVSYPTPRTGVAVFR